MKQKYLQFIKGKSFLITGGTGSFGKSITTELLKYHPKIIKIYSRSEDKQEQMKYQFRNNNGLLFILGDVRDLDQLTRAMEGVDYVFHAAAQKQVPGTEHNVLEAVKTNVLGAQNVIDASRFSTVKKAIAISTDKAVEPINAMGMTKAIQERLFVHSGMTLQTRKIAFSCVRYGNVLGSTGSVLPLFLHQLAHREPLTLTNRQMTRFIITLDQAVDLVLTALADSVGGEIFIPKIPSHLLSDLAESVIEMFPQKKGRVIVSGIRIGEKIHETLMTPNERVTSIEKSGYYIVLPAISNREIEKKFSIEPKGIFQAFSSDKAEMLAKPQLKKILEHNILVKNFT